VRQGKPLSLCCVESSCAAATDAPLLPLHCCCCCWLQVWQTFQGHLLIQAHLNGRQAGWMLLDTGACERGATDRVGRAVTVHDACPQLWLAVLCLDFVCVWGGTLSKTEAENSQSACV
jgi:hypothetical protein